MSRAVWPFAVALLACGGTLPPGLSASEVSALPIEQGIAGRLAVRTGVCGTVVNSCRVYVPGVLVRAVSVSGGEGFVVTGDGCSLGRADLPLSGRALPDVDGRNGTVEGDVYSIGLDPGRYSVVLIGPNDCVTCLSFAATAGAGERCAVTAVTEGSVTVADFIEDYAAE